MEDMTQVPAVWGKTKYVKFLIWWQLLANEERQERNQGRTEKGKTNLLMAAKCIQNEYIDDWKIKCNIREMYKWMEIKVFPINQTLRKQSQL